LNTHYGEGPVKVLATFKIYEFDKAKYEALTNPPKPPPAAPARGGAARPAPTRPAQSAEPAPEN
jgi:hypothetical protein